MKTRFKFPYFRFISFIAMIFVLTGCATTINPKSPEIIITEASIPKQEVSTIKIPIKLNLAPYFEETNASVPTKFAGNEQVCEGVSFAYEFIRDEIEFRGAGKKLQFDVDGRYSLLLNYCPQCTELFDNEGSCIVPRIHASCGIDEPKRKIHVGYDMQIGVLNNYQLKSTTSLRTVEALSPCEISVFSYDVSETLEAELSDALKAVEKDIDKEIAAIELRPIMVETWNLLSQPTDLEGYGFLYIRPEDISMSEIRFKGDTAYFNALLQARPMIHMNEVKMRPKQLPRLSTYEDQDGFDITMDIYGEYDSLSAILTASLKGTTVDVGGREVIFGDINIHGASDQKIHLKVEFDGKKKGTLYLTGTPVFDALRQHISFPDLEFDIDTKSALLNSAKWLFDKKITNAIRDAASMDLKPYLDTLRATLNSSLNMELDENIFLKGKVDDVLIKMIHPMENQLHIRVNSVGKLEMVM
ncbi:MAG: DUF4403 family protein [Crocinitomicaceae bacterium]|nr:DUF4403 family protein [Crocinitomicaceae bacterium]